MQPGLVDLRRAREDLARAADPGEAAPLDAAGDEGLGDRHQPPLRVVGDEHGTGHLAPVRAPGAQRGLRRCARGLGRGAAGVELAPAGRVERARRFALQRRLAPRQVGHRRRAGPWCRDGRGAEQISSEGPHSTMRPRYITAMRSATTRAAARSWVTNSTAIPSSRRSCPIRLRTVAASETSSALVGSSHRRTSGGTTVARASAARWR